MNQHGEHDCCGHMNHHIADSMRCRPISPQGPVERERGHDEWARFSAVPRDLGWERVRGGVIDDVSEVIEVVGAAKRRLVQQDDPGK